MRPAALRDGARSLEAWNMPVEPSLYLVDGSGYIFRAFFAVKGTLTTARGLPTNALMGFTRMLRALLEAEHPEYIAVAFDTPVKTFRSEMYPEYKAHRPPPPPDLVPQFPYFAKIVAAMNIPVLIEEGWEADDLIGTLAERAKTEWGLRPIVVTGDKDLMQLVDDRTTMFDPMKSRWYRPPDVEERFGVPPALVADVLGLAGDTSDNIPGVPGIGEKTAAKLLGEFGTLDELLARGEEVKGKRGESLRQFADQAVLSRDLATIRRDAPVDVTVEDLKLTGPDVPVLRELYRELEFNRFLRELDAESGADTATEEAHDYRTLLTVDAVRQAAAAARGADLVAFDTETTSTDPMAAKLVGVSLSWAPGEAVYVPLAHYYVGVPDQPPMAEVLDVLRPLLEDPDVPKTAQNHKYDWKVLKRYGVDVRGVVVDPMLSSYVLKPSRHSHGLDHLAMEYVGHRMISYSEVTEGVRGASFANVAVAKATEYSGEDADYTLRVAQLLRDEVDREGLTAILDDLELPLARVLALMEMEGMLVDREVLGVLSVEFDGRIAALGEEIQALAGKPFNIGSPKQLGEVLFDDLGLPVVKKTKTARSTDQSVLEELAGKHELPAKVLQWRHLSKLKSTYIDALPEAIHAETGRVHSSFKQAVAATGRLSSDSPNLQNIPVRSEEGRRIRTAFVAPPGHVLLSADYSQVELRVLAHLAGDEALIAAFRDGADIHQRTASEIFGVFPEMVSSAQRTAAKAINFGIMYGMSAFRLARELKIPRKQAKDYIQAYFGRYERIRGFLDETLSQARERGYTETLFGRRRWLPDLASSDHQVRSRAEREAINAPVQGTAADLLKMAMVRIGDAIEGGELDARLVLTVHDELLFEVAEDRVERVAGEVRDYMEGVAELAVPLRVDVSWGKTWAEAK